MTGSSESTNNADTSADIVSDGTVLLFEVDLASTVSLTGMTLSGGDRCPENNHRIFRRSDRLQLYSKQQYNFS